MPPALCHPSTPLGTKHSSVLLPRPLRWSEGLGAAQHPQPRGVTFARPHSPWQPAPREQGAHAGTPHTGVHVSGTLRFSWPASAAPAAHTTHSSCHLCIPREISAHFISMRKSALESSSLCEFRPRGHGDASRRALAPACMGMCTRGCWWHRAVLAHGTPGTAAPNPPVSWLLRLWAGSPNTRAPKPFLHPEARQGKASRSCSSAASVTSAVPEKPG